MKFKNITNNSVQLDDIDLSISYGSEIVHSIDLESVKKSNSFQLMVELGAFKIIECGDSRIEKKLLQYNSVEMTNSEIVPTKESGQKCEVLVRGHFYDATGYAKVNRNLALNLCKAGLNVAIEPVNSQNYLNEIETRILGLLRREQGKDTILIDSVIPPQAKVARHAYNILYTTAESNRVPKQFIEIANRYDELWVTSNFCANSFSASGYKKDISVVPPIINCNLYKPSSTFYEFRPKLKKFKFLSVQTFGYRKGTDALLHSFCKAFTEASDVCLFLLIAEKSTKQQKKVRSEIEKIKSNYTNPPQIVVSFKSIPEYLMPNFYSSFDAFVLTSRGEGFGLPICEASVCGIPVLCLFYGGPKDFLTEDNSLLVYHDTMEQANSGKTGVHYWDMQDFPRLGTNFQENCARAMREMVKKIDNYRALNTDLSKFVQDNYDGKKVSSWCKVRLEEIYNRGKKK